LFNFVKSINHSFLIINTENVMKNMKFGFIGAFAIATAIFFAGCTDPCKDVVCNNGECVEGDCVCDAGYEGVDCATAFNAKFSGTYSLNETCDASGSDAYTVTLTPSSSEPARANLTGLYRETFSVPLAIGTDGVTFTIASTDIGPGSVVTTGTSTANAEGTTINLVYRFTSEAVGNPQDNCTAVLTRQ
jgi:hypothetical protein